MSIEATIFVWKLNKKQVSSTEKLVLLSYADRADENGNAYPSVKRLIEDTLLDRKTILKAVASLSEKKIIIKTGEYKGRTKQVPVYQFPTTDFRENLTPNSPKNGTGTKNGTGPKIGTCTGPKIGTRNLPIESPIESLINNKNKKLITNQKTNDLTFENISEDNPHSIPQNLIDEWLDNRKSQKTRTSKIAWQRINKVLSRLLQAGLNPIEAFERMVCNGWRGIEYSYFEQEIKLKKRDMSNHDENYKLGADRNEFGF